MTKDTPCTIDFKAKSSLQQSMCDGAIVILVVLAGMLPSRVRNVFYERLFGPILSRAPEDADPSCGIAGT